MSETKICPYPGLRPFTEEESIFFKGRDLHIQQIIAQLEEKKFVMLTGASGDGKSSVVYAGVIPNARAGFFKAKFNNWVIADFKPARTPLKNMASSLSQHLQLDAEKVEKELRSGFSALIDVYKMSKYHLDTEGAEYKNADEKGKKILKRKAANFFLLIDQFEEFFTNAENFSQGKPSSESQLVVNLILETARIAYEQDLPVYIICTMRSDYIGQCAAFRGLPEFIGFSQFFVPRLKRKEIYQVIEEPARLSGNDISRRLTETLINELREGIDQLPVLQHALNQVWKKATEGNETMDMIHLAKISGLPAKHLPSDDQKEFEIWYNKIKEKNQDILSVVERDFGNPSLENVLNTHANELLETAFDYAAQRNESVKTLSRDESRQIIKTSFQCLTKIDASRAVRNRMTLQEITHIINLPHISATQVGGILNIFREQGNTFISPFITDQLETLNIKPETVLDITHESLIRNWEMLNLWAKEEHEDRQDFLDFNKQLQRWVNNNKSKGFLLPIGSLTYFENWYNKCKPNKHWLTKYDDRDIPVEHKLEAAEKILINAKEFLRRSTLKHLVSRTIVKYGANRIAAVLGIIALIISCTYYYFDFRQKQNDYVIKEILERGRGMLKSKKIKDKVKANYLINAERLKPGTFKHILNELHDDTLAFGIAFETFMSVQNYDDIDRKGINPMAPDVVSYIDSTLNVILTSKKVLYKSNVNNDLLRINKLLSIFAFIEINDRKEVKYNRLKSKYQIILNDNIISALKNEANEETKLKVKNSENKFTTKSKNVISQLINPQKPGSLNVKILNQSIELSVSLANEQSKNTLSQIDSLLKYISPFENDIGKRLFSKLYSKEKKWKVDWEKVLTHNGGYQILAYLYSAKGDFKKLNSCLDSVITNNSEYKGYYNENFLIVSFCCAQMWNIYDVLL
ncbi:MAG: hypothetical protein HY958_02915 [Bacteroidia bacterium]|nr:hypothetical protein [Bacteroidia bacterium]